jgi:hypothetical protein
MGQLARAGNSAKALSYMSLQVPALPIGNPNYFKMLPPRLNKIYSPVTPCPVSETFVREMPIDNIDF